MPGGGRAVRFRFAIADNASDQQIGIVERGAIGVMRL